MLWLAIKRLRPNATFELMQDGTNEGRPYVANYSDPAGLPLPSPAEISTALAEIDAQLAAEAGAASQLRQLVRQVAGGAVGVKLPDLTAQQVRALLAVLLWRLGALGPDGAVRPLDEWADRRQ